jgi:glycosyltransferase GT-like protein
VPEESLATQTLAVAELRDEVRHDSWKRWPKQVSGAYWAFMVDAATALGAKRIVEIGCGYGRHVGGDPVQYTGVDYGYFVEFANRLDPSRDWVKVDFDRCRRDHFATFRDPNAVFFSRGRVEHVRDVELLLDCLADLAQESPVVVALEAADAVHADDLKPFFRRAVVPGALATSFEARGLEARLLGSLPAPDSARQLVLLATGGPGVLPEGTALEKGLEAVLEAAPPPPAPQPRAGTGAEEDGEALSPDSILFTAELPLLSTRVSNPTEGQPPRELSIGDVSREILMAKQARRPFSLVRLGNGEARVLGFPDFVPPIWLARSVRNWFRDRAAELQVRPLQDEAERLIADADLIGVLRSSYPDEQYRLAHTLLEVYGLIAPGAALCSSNAHLHLLERDFYRDLLAGEEQISIVSGHQLAEPISSAFGVPHVRQFKVPAQAKFFYDPSEEPHFPTVFERLREELDVRWPGEVFLIGAGYVGKIYCGWVKERGGIAIDIGSVFDLWAGEATRGSDSSAARQHRLG